MADSFLRHSPLAHLGLAARASEPGSEREAGVLMGERPFRGLVDLRGPAGDEAFDAAVQEALGVGLPVEPNTVTSTGDLSAFWLGPDEWWVVTPAEGPAMADTLRAALAGRTAAVTDVSESRTCIRVRGPRARDLLAKGCPLDLHPRKFSAGQCAQSHCAKTMITLHQVADGADDEADDEADDSGGENGGPTYDLYVLNSFAEYLWLWLEDAAREYGLGVVAE